MNIVNLLNLACRPRKLPVTTIVLHATAGKSASSSISWLRKIGLSYHAIIGDGLKSDNGTIYKCVPYGRVAYHAGKSVGPGGANVNAYSIGVSFACLDDGKDAITEAQYEAAVELCVALMRAYPSIQWVTTHALIAPKRKVDPRGPVKGMAWDGKFPLKEFVMDVNKRLERLPSYQRAKKWGP